MKKTVTLSTFRDAFRAHERLTNFTSDGLDILFDDFWNHLFDDLKQYEEIGGQELELDVIAFCCEYSELTLSEANHNYGWEFETLDELAEHLHEETHVCGTTDTTVIFQCF